MLQRRSPPQIGPTQVREGRRMAGAEAPKGRGAPLGRTTMKGKMYLQGCALCVKRFRALRGALQASDKMGAHTSACTGGGI